MFCFQRIREGSVVHQIQVINVGDMIESINGHRLIGCRHYEVAKMLKELPKGKEFIIKLVEPLKAFGRGLDLRYVQHCANGSITGGNRTKQSQFYYDA